MPHAVKVEDRGIQAVLREQIGKEKESEIPGQSIYRKDSLRKSR